MDCVLCLDDILLFCCHISRTRRILTPGCMPTAALTARPIYASRGRKDAGPGVHFVSPGLLQLTVLRHHRRSREPAAVCPECGCTFGVGRTTLASGSTLGGFQDGHPGLPVTLQHGSSLSGRRLSVGLRRQSSSAAFKHEPIQQLWRQVFFSCRSKAVEQPSS